MSGARRCFCGKVHPEWPQELPEAWEKVWHELAMALRVPELVEWLSKKLR